MAGKIGAKAIKPNPALKPFEPLLGEWQITGQHPYFPDVELHGRAVFEWIDGGAFLMMRSEVDNPKFPDGIAIFGSDNISNQYFMLYFDERDTSRMYQVAITKKELKWWRDDAKFSQHFTMTIEKDKLIASGEMRREGGEWEKDLSLTYERL